MNGTAATMRAAAAEARANPGAFWTQLGAMALNDVVWIVFWVLFFRSVGTVRGWDRSRIILLYAVLTTAGGIVLGLLSNARRIAQLVTDGGIDAALALPVRPLAHLLVRRVDAVNIGDLVFGVALFLVIGHPTPQRTLIYLVGSAASAAIIAGFLVTVGSLTFFSGRGEAGDLGFHAIVLLSSYPADIFGGVTKIVLYTVVPAGFVAAFPSRLIDEFSIGALAVLLAVAVAAVATASAVFTAGLRRYTSSALWTRA